MVPRHIYFHRTSNLINVRNFPEVHYKCANQRSCNAQCAPLCAGARCGRCGGGAWWLLDCWIGRQVVDFGFLEKRAAQLTYSCCAAHATYGQHATPPPPSVVMR